MKRISIFLILATLLPVIARAQSTRTGFPPPEQNLRIFRCVLDTRPRCLVYNLAPEMSLAWDTENGILWRGWQPSNPKMPVNLVGAVYDGKHGPQPTHQGQLVFDDAKPQLTNEAGHQLKLRYLGHRTVGDQQTPILRWAIQDDTGKEIATITQSASFDLTKSQLQLTITLDSEATVSFTPPGPLKWSQATITLKQGDNHLTAKL